MSNARVIRRPNARPLGTTAGKKSSGGKKKWIISTVILLLMAVAAWALVPAGPDPAVARVQGLRDQMENAAPEQRRELWGKLREEYRNLPEEDREQMWSERRQLWEAREQKFLNEFFAMTPAEQMAKIDEQLEEDEERRKRWAERRSQQGDRQARGGQRGGGRDGFRGRGRSGRSSIERRKGYLDRTTPQTRAQRSEYRRLRAERREQLGLPARRRW